MARMRNVQFLEAIVVGNVTDALCVAPWGYTSRALPGGGFAFRFTDGPYKTDTPVNGPTLHAAVEGSIRRATLSVRAEGNPE